MIEADESNDMAMSLYFYLLIKVWNDIGSDYIEDVCNVILNMLKSCENNLLKPKLRT